MKKIQAICRNVENWFQRMAFPNHSKSQGWTPAQWTTSARSTRRSVPVVVRRNPRPYWEERGWQRDGQAFTGNFQTRFGNWQGYVMVSPSGRVDVFIHNPPPVLQNHPHWQCFQKRHDGWFFVHPIVRVPDVSAGILGVEKTLIEAFTL